MFTISLLRRLPVPFACVLCGVATALASTQQPAAINFSGTWILQKQASEGLSPATTGADRVTWTIVQDAKTITLTENMVGGPRPSSGSLGTYHLDGAETTPSAGGGRVILTLRAKWVGPRLELLRKQTVSGDNPVETNASRTLTLSADGKALTVTMRYQAARGTSDSKWVFSKE